MHVVFSGTASAGSPLQHVTGSANFAAMPGQPLRVIINDRILRAPRTGIGHYIAELIARVPQADSGIELITPFAGRVRAGSGPPDGGGHGDQRRAVSPLLRAIAEHGYQTAFRCLGWARRCRLYHEPGHISGPWGGVTLTTMHDLSVLRFPQWHPADRVRWHERQLPRAAARTSHFVAVSEFTKREMVELLGIRPERVTVIHLAAREIFRPRSPEPVRAWLGQRGLPETYLLYVGAIEPRKNLDGLLHAFAGLPAGLRGRFPLLIAGGTGWGGIDLEQLVRTHGLGSQVRLLGYQGDESLALLYAGARALVWPTFYEGFGLPPLEAMATGTPVIAGATSSIPEVVADAGLLVDPHDPAAISAAMQAVLEDRTLADRLNQAGRRRAAEFSWGRCAAEHAALYRRVAE